MKPMTDVALRLWAALPTDSRTVSAAVPVKPSSLITRAGDVGALRLEEAGDCCRDEQQREQRQEQRQRECRGEAGAVDLAEPVLNIEDPAQPTPCLGGRTGGRAIPSGRPEPDCQCSSSSL